MTEDKYKISIKGPGLTFDQVVEKSDANAIMTFVMTGSAFPSGGTPANGAGSVDAGGAASSLSAGGGRPQTIKQFIATKRPSTQYERVACIAYYLTHSDNTPEFKTRAITKANTSAAQPRIANPSQIVSDATKTYGFLSAASRGMKQISVLGEAVVEALPDREAVKAAIANNRPRRKAKRGAKRKN